MQIALFFEAEYKKVASMIVQRDVSVERNHFSFFSSFTISSELISLKHFAMIDVDCLRHKSYTVSISCADDKSF